MFGHVKGAFTGATNQRMGRFELADGGSIFLDEIGELDKILQAKLLQVLQDSSFERVGESKATKVTVRIISATNADLEAMIRNKTFREDLYYRLAASTIKLPPLRERHGELEGLVRHIVTMLNPDTERELYFSPGAWEYMQSYQWPGNVRELTNVVKRLLIATPADSEVELHTLIPLLRSSTAQNALVQPNIAYHPEPKATPAVDHQLPQDLSIAANEKQLIERVLTMTNGIVSGKKGAAALLKLPRSTLLYKMRKHGIVPSDYAIRQS
jgi:transcriptional regulator with GAF, ATPase, and Fis domain